MRRDHTPFDIEADEQAEITQQFWGSTRGWDPDPSAIGADDDHTTGSLRAIRASLTGTRTRRGSNGPSGRPRLSQSRSGGIDRTRSHGIVRPELAPQGQPSAGSRSAREATLAELAAGWDDDVWPDPDWSAPTRRLRQPANPPMPARVRQPAPRDSGGGYEQFDGWDPHASDRYDEQDDGQLVPLSPVQPLAKRLGLGAVDPLLARLGAIVFVGVMLVPVALAARGGSDSIASMSADLVATPIEPTAQAASPASSPSLGASQPDLAPTVATADAPAVAPATPLSSEAAVTAQVETSAATAAPAPAVTDPPATVSSSRSTPADVPEAVTTGTDAPAEVATVSEPADRVELECALTYVAGPGDSWYRIADAAGVSPSAVMDANLAGLETPIYPGDEICLPAGATMPSQPTTTTAPTTTAATTTTTTTTVKATTTTTAPPAPATTAQVQQIIREIWPDELEEKALQVAWRESNYKATAYNGTCCYGVFQLHWTSHKSWLDDHGILTTTDLFDARKNITAAYALYVRSGGWGPWGG